MNQIDRTNRPSSEQPAKREWQTPRLEREGKVAEVTLTPPIGSGLH